MDLKLEALLLVILCGILLLMAFKTGSIGGGGAGADRTENPVLFWMGVPITAFMAIVGAGALVSQLL